MKTWERYLTKEFIAAFGGCLFTFIMLGVVLDFFGHLDEILKNNVGILVLGKYYLNYVPIVFVETTYFATLLSLLYVLGQCQRHNEITALKASGLSLYRIIFPFLVLGFLIGLINLLVNEKIVPACWARNQRIKEERIKDASSSPAPVSLRDVVLYSKDNRLFYIGRFRYEEKTLENIIILEHDDKNRVKRKIDSPRGRFSGNYLVLAGASVFEYEAGKAAGRPKFFSEFYLAVSETPRDFARTEMETQFLSYRQLKGRIKLFSQGGSLPRREIVDYYTHFSRPWMSLIIVLIGASFALGGTSRGGALAGMGLAIITALLYFILDSLSIVLGKGGSLPMLVSAWLANIIFASAGVWLLIKTPK